MLSFRRRLLTDHQITHRPSFFFFLFALSGFSGLIYESIWTHYLKLFLGHAAYSQVLVLAIFMGGMAGGAWICSKYSPRWKNMFIGYAIAEGLIGIVALLFHEGFLQALTLAYDHVLPQLKSSSAINSFKWGLSAALILPQSVLLGMTFPLMSAAMLRAFPGKPGSTVSLLYFTNSIGAAIGVLTSGFVLVEAVGLPGTVATAGIINIILAIIVWLLAPRSIDAPVSLASTSENTGKTLFHKGSSLSRVLLVVSLVTGVASFIYEIGWIRMLSLVLGSSTHAFELMLSAFISGLAFGGLWIRKRIDRIATPISFLAYVQVVMGLLALSTIPIYQNTFPLMQWIVNNLDRTTGGYALFNLGSNGIALIIMLPTTFCAGMTLPLITYTLLKEGHGEKSIGQVYAANTIGAIIGIFLAIYLGMPLLGVKGLIIFGAGLDIALGLALCWLVTKGSSRTVPVVVTACSLGVLVFTALFVTIDPFRMASGVYRNGKLLDPAKYQLLYHRDGKTATVSLALTKGGTMTIRTNGKSDAAINTNSNGMHTSDESTMTLLATLPLILHPRAEAVANIGFGSGLTTHVLLGAEHLRKVDTIEIEPFMVEAARHFGERTKRAYEDSRSRVVIDDAKAFFSSNNAKYDIIVSEPSNPWVSGVSGLFSEEFYSLINKYIEDDGLFVQWLQIYEINDELVASVLKGLSANFSDYDIYTSNMSDLIIVAKKTGLIGKLSREVFSQKRVAEDLSRVDIRSLQDLELRRIAGKKIIDRLNDTFDIQANSDYWPVLDQNAARARFLHTRATGLTAFSEEPLPITEILENRIREEMKTNVTLANDFKKTYTVTVAMALRDYFLDEDADRNNPLFNALSEETRVGAQQMRSLFFEPGAIAGPNRKVFLFNTAKNMIPYLTPSEAESVLDRLASGPAMRFFDQTEQDYFQLFRALGKRNGSELARISARLLDTDRDLTPARMKYLVALGMLGKISSGRHEKSKELWAAYGPRLYPDGEPSPTFKLLLAVQGG